MSSLIALELFYTGLLVLATLAIGGVSVVVLYNLFRVRADEQHSGIRGTGPADSKRGCLVIELPSGVSAELVPLSWLLGVWEGTGVVEYTVGESVERHEFRQRVSFSHDGLPHLNYSSSTWLLDAESNAGVGADDPSSGFDPTPLATETGYWRLSRPLSDADPGPGLLPGVGERPFTTAADVETLRNADKGFDIELSLVHPGGVSEVYLGQVKGPRIQLATDAVLRTDGSKSYSAATRLYGLVEGDLLWAWDIAALGQELRTHASGRLARLE